MTHDKMCRQKQHQPTYRLCHFFQEVVSVERLSSWVDEVFPFAVGSGPIWGHAIRRPFIFAPAVPNLVGHPGIVRNVSSVELPHVGGFDHLPRTDSIPSLRAGLFGRAIRAHQRVQMAAAFLIPIWIVAHFIIACFNTASRICIFVCIRHADVPVVKEHHLARVLHTCRTDQLTAKCYNTAQAVERHTSSQCLCLPAGRGSKTYMEIALVLPHELSRLQEEACRPRIRFAVLFGEVPAWRARMTGERSHLGLPCGWNCLQHTTTWGRCTPRLYPCPWSRCSCIWRYRWPSSSR